MVHVLATDSKITVTLDSGSVVFMGEDIFSVAVFGDLSNSQIAMAIDAIVEKKAATKPFLMLDVDYDVVEIMKFSRKMRHIGINKIRTTSNGTYYLFHTGELNIKHADTGDIAAAYIELGNAKLGLVLDRRLIPAQLELIKSSVEFVDQFQDAEKLMYRIAAMVIGSVPEFTADFEKDGFRPMMSSWYDTYEYRDGVYVR